MTKISYYDRKTNNKYRMKFKVNIPDHYVYVREEVIEEESELPTTNMRKAKVTSDALRKFKITDFSIENLKMAGAIDNLKHSHLERDPLGTIANMENAAHAIVNNSKNE